MTEAVWGFSWVTSFFFFLCFVGWRVFLEILTLCPTTGQLFPPYRPAISGVLWLRALDMPPCCTFGRVLLCGFFNFFNCFLPHLQPVT